ncbi:MAG TPA: biopolymer transporter ExbD [Steroidobacteraceae bacterium]|nr:biopolymer transporter ExbD [Steroidobacteraceae bacterium]
MSGSSIARRQARNHARYKGRNDINIVPMLDIFTILVFFLIFTAVFSKTHIVEMNLPAQSSEPLSLPEGLVLEIVVRKDGLVVQDKNSGPLQPFPNNEQGYDFDGLNSYLTRVKARFPELKSATVLLEQNIPYDTIIATMDAVKSYEGTLDGQPARGELFPQISLGDAPT